MKRLEIAVREGEKVKVFASGEYVYSKFVGWYDGEGENATLISTEYLHEFIVMKETTVYARFEKTFSVSAIIENGGEVLFESQLVDIGITFQKMVFIAMIYLKILRLQ